MCASGAKSRGANDEDRNTAAVAGKPNETGPLIRPGRRILGQNPTRIGCVILAHVRRAAPERASNPVGNSVPRTVRLETDVIHPVLVATSGHREECRTTCLWLACVKHLSYSPGTGERYHPVNRRERVCPERRRSIIWCTAMAQSRRRVEYCASCGLAFCWSSRNCFCRIGFDGRVARPSRTQRPRMNGGWKAPAFLRYWNGEVVL